MPARETLRNAVSIAKKIGVTRLADITHMDVLRIPNYSAVLPGTEDYIWVYGGKGFTKDTAKSSALMESIERYSSLPSSGSKNFVRASFSELESASDSGEVQSQKVLHPDEVIEPLSFEYKNSMAMDFLSGFELIKNDRILVPAPLALFRYTPTLPAVNPFAFHHTNGLASGNVIEEAVCHALCEVIERDASSLAELRASAIPFHIFHSITASLRTSGFSIDPIRADTFVDDPGVFPDVDLSELQFQPIQALLKRFDRAGIPLIIKDITSDIGIPTFNASCVEWVSQDYGYLAEGSGTHPDARIALLRSITEVSQTRAANIQGSRDDLRKIKYGQNNNDDKRAWQFRESKEKVKFSTIMTFSNKDILDDIKLILNRLERCGLKRVIIVNLTIPELGIPVVRAIVPGLETFKITKTVMGWRARKHFRQWL